MAKELSPIEKMSRKRNPAKSKAKILQIGAAEFCSHGYSGARIERIAKKCKCSMRMIYHYFGNKEGLYLAILEAAYLRIRNEEKSLDLSTAEPIEGIRQLIEFTYHFFESNHDVLAIISEENSLRGRFLRKHAHVKAMTVPLIESIRTLLEQGNRLGYFRPNVDPVQFYVSLVALSQIHILHRHTLSIITSKDMSNTSWQEQRRLHVRDVLMDHLFAGAQNLARPNLQFEKQNA
jgi:AcrR family transcriptional regulator